MNEENGRENHKDAKTERKRECEKKKRERKKQKERVAIRINRDVYDVYPNRRIVTRLSLLIRNY